ncbi:MAG: dihydrolipoyl dehydrogenase [Bacillota bacterium]
MRKRIVIIGGGPGGYVAAIRGAQLGAEVHLVESDRLGGTCLNMGCIPTKTLLHTAELYRIVKNGAKIGLKTDGLRVEWPVLMKRKEAVVNSLVQGVTALLKANKVAVYKGHAVLQDERTVKIDAPTPQTLSADAIILGVGSVPVKPPFPGADLPNVLDSTAALSLPEIPSSLVIIGGGVIGTEFAALYNSLGTKVTVVEMLPEILPAVDGQIVSVIKKDLSSRGVDFLTEARLSEVRDAKKGLTAKVLTGQNQLEINGEYVLVAVGRRPNTENLGLESVGVKTEKGAILVNEHFETNVPGIYAIGDCNAQTMLAHVASAQGIRAVEHALGYRSFYNRKVLPYCIYTSPEVAGVGLTEEQARNQGLSYRTGIFPLAGNGKSIIEHCENGLVKIIADTKYKEILGVHIVGPHATDLIAEGALAISLEATVEELIALIHAHPTISEAVAEAAHAVIGNPIHWPPGVKKDIM